MPIHRLSHHCLAQQFPYPCSLIVRGAFRTGIGLWPPPSSQSLLSWVRSQALILVDLKSFTSFSSRHLLSLTSATAPRTHSPSQTFPPQGLRTCQFSCLECSSPAPLFSIFSFTQVFVPRVSLRCTSFNMIQAPTSQHPSLFSHTSMFSIILSNQ